MSKHPEGCLNSTIPTKPSKFYWVYVIQSVAPRVDKQGRPRPGFFYVGMTTDPARRLREHNGLYANGNPGNPNGGKYTSKHRPWLLGAIYGPFNSRSEALRAEYALKQGKRGVNRTRWSTSDSPWCRGAGSADPRIPECNRWVRQQLSISGPVATPLPATLEDPPREPE